MWWFCHREVYLPHLVEANVHGETTHPRFLHHLARRLNKIPDVEGNPWKASRVNGETKPDKDEWQMDARPNDRPTTVRTINGRGNIHYIFWLASVTGEEAMRVMAGVIHACLRIEIKAVRFTALSSIVPSWLPTCTLSLFVAAHVLN